MHPYRAQNYAQNARSPPLPAVSALKATQSQPHNTSYGKNMHLLEKPATSVKSLGSAYSMETEHSISRSFGSHNGGGNVLLPPTDDDELKQQQQLQNQLQDDHRARQNYGNYTAPKITTATTTGNPILGHTGNTPRDRLKNIKIKLTPTSSTPMKPSPNHNNHANPHLHQNSITWQTYIGHFVFHEHDRGHSLYHQFKKIGEGVFARVYKTVRKEPQRTVALKVFPKKNQHAQGSFANELMLLHNVSHPNIIHLYDAHVDPKYFYLEMEVCRGGDIFKHISRHGRIPEQFTRQIIFKIIDAIQCFHEKDFVHRDLKPENVVFARQNDITDIRLIDFGESINVDPTAYYNEFVGTPCYFAPERFRQHTGNELKKSDVWAIGVIMFEMLTGCRCFNGGDNQREVRDNILNMKHEPFPPDVSLSHEAVDLFHKLLEPEPLKRYSCQEALRHPWFKDIFSQRQQFIYSPANPHVHMSPRLTPLQKAVQSPIPQALPHDVSAMQAIVIRTSQSMTNLESILQHQLEARKATKRFQRKYKESDTKRKMTAPNKTDTTSLNEAKRDGQEDEEDDDDDDEYQRVRIAITTRKKSRSLEERELLSSFRKGQEGGKLHRLSLQWQEKNPYKYRNKHRSNTLGTELMKSHQSVQSSPVNVTIHTKAADEKKQEDEEEEEDEEVEEGQLVINLTENENENEIDTVTPLQSAENSPIHRLKHQKSLSSPGMNITINAAAKPSYNGYSVGYHPSPVHEDIEHNNEEHEYNRYNHGNSSSSTFITHNQQQWRTMSKSSANGGAQSSVSYTNSGYHEKKSSNSFSFINANFEHSQSYTDEANMKNNSSHYQYDPMPTHTLIEEEQMD